MPEIKRRGREPKDQRPIVVDDFVYNDPEKCPDELVLFFHHLPYTHKLHSGKTVIQHIYDTHFEGYDEAMMFIETYGDNIAFIIREEVRA